MKRQVKTNEHGRFGINVPKKIIDDALNKTYSVLVAATSTESAPSRVYAWPMEGADDSHGGRHVLLQMRGTLGPQVLEADGTRSRLLPATKRTSKADGTFQFRGLELGQHRVQVSAPGYATYTGHVVVHQGSPSSMALTLESGATLSGTLTREDGLAPTKGLVHVFHRDPYAVQTARIGPKGQFVLKDLRPGPVRVVAEERLPREKVAQRMVSQNVALGPGESRSITLEMHSPATAQVRVLKRTDGLLEPVTHLTL